LTHFFAEKTSHDSLHKKDSEKNIKKSKKPRKTNWARAACEEKRKDKKKTV
jgi:ribosomal protein L24E